MLRASLALDISKFSSVSSLNDTTKASGTQRLTKGFKIFGTNCNAIFGGPLDEILWTACKTHKIRFIEKKENIEKQFHEKFTISFDGI